MINSFGNKLAKDLVEENESKEWRHFPKELVRMTRRKLAMIHAASNIKDLSIPPGNRLKKLAGGQDIYSIRINDQWRITFKFKAGHAYQVKVEDYHS